MKRSFFILVLMGLTLLAGVALGNRYPFALKRIATMAGDVLLNRSHSIKSRDPDAVHLYKRPAEGKPLSLHVFNADANVRTVEPPVTIIFFHGGGWITGSADIFYPHCTWLSSQGMDCITAEYRTTESHQTSPLHSVEDAKDAYAYVAKNASLLGVNSSNAYVAGGSAGGQIAAAISTADYPEFGMPKYYPQGVVLLATVIDNSVTGYGNERIKFFGDRFSPLENLDEYFPRTLFILGDRDRFVPVDTAKEFVSRLERSGVDATLEVYSGGYHSFYMDAFFEETVQDIERWLLMDSACVSGC